jgi:hypothetical protein
VIGFSSLTNLYLFTWRFYDLSRHDYPYYLHRDEVAALRWLEANAAGEDVVLGALAIVQYVPAETGAHAFLAHWAQTVDYYGKEAAVTHFFDVATSDRERLQLIADFGVDYVVDGPAEQALGAFRLEESPHFRRLFASGQVGVYAPVRK